MCERIQHWLGGFEQYIGILKREISAWRLRYFNLWQGSATYSTSAKGGGEVDPECHLGIKSRGYWVLTRHLLSLPTLPEFRSQMSLPHKEEKRLAASSLSEAIFPSSHWAPSSALSFSFGKKVVWHTALEKMLTLVLHLTLPRETSLVVEFSYIRACVPNPVNLCVC